MSSFQSYVMSSLQQLVLGCVNARLFFNSFGYLFYGFIKDERLARHWQLGGARLWQIDGIFLHGLVAGGEVGAGEEEHPLVCSESLRVITYQQIN